MLSNTPLSWLDWLNAVQEQHEWAYRILWYGVERVQKSGLSSKTVSFVCQGTGLSLDGNRSKRQAQSIK